jgi:hypothetical protein
MSYQYGTVYPHTPRQILLYPLEDAVWHMLVIDPARHSKIVQQLRAAHVRVVYPETVSVSWPRGKRLETKRPSMPGLLMAKFHRRPNWQEIAHRSLMRRVYCRQSHYGPIPYEASADDVQRFLGLPTEAERLAAEHEERMRPKPGDEILVQFGPGERWAAIVREFRDGTVWWETDTGIKGKSERERVTKVEAAE